LRSIPSSEILRLCNHPEQQVLPESIELKKFPEQTPIHSITNDAERVSEDPTSLNLEQLQSTHSSSQRKRETSSTMIRVEFPKTVNLGAHAEIYESKSKAIAALYVYKLSELSNFCTYDPSTHTIFAHALESSVPNPAVLKQAGLEIIWLPMQKDIVKMIQTEEKTSEKKDLSETKNNSSFPVSEKKSLVAKEECSVFNNPGTSLKPDMLSAHNDGMLTANIHNLDRRGSYFELETKLIAPGPQSPSSSLEINSASPQREEEASIFDDDFFLEVDPELARSFLGSQYSEASRSSSPNGNRLSPADLFGTDSARELLWSLDESEDAKPVKTWVEVGREYLTKHPTNTARHSQDDHKATNEGSEYSASRSDKISSRKSSVGPYSEHIEDVRIFEKCQSLKQRFTRRPSLSSILLDDISFGCLKRKNCRSWSNSPSSTRKQTIAHHEHVVDLEVMSAWTPEILKMDSSGFHQFPDVKDSLGYEVSKIPFPTEEIGDRSSRQSSVSYTSYIEAERARERLYQESLTVTPFKVGAGNEGHKVVAEICSEAKHSAGTRECSTGYFDSVARSLDNTGSQLESQDGETVLGEEIKTRRVRSDEHMSLRRSSNISLASGFRFTNYGNQMDGEEGYRRGREIHSYPASEDSSEYTDWQRSSVTSLASGFRFTKYSKQTTGVGCREGEKISKKSAFEDVASVAWQPHLGELPGCSIATSTDDLTDAADGNSSEPESGKGQETPRREELASEHSRDTNLSHFPRGSHHHRSISWKAAIEDLNMRVVGKAARQSSPAKQDGKNVGALVDIFQARGLMQSIRPALYRKQSPAPFLHHSVGQPATPSARIITLSGSVYHPAGTVCVAAGHPLSTSPIKRVPTPRSPIVRPSSGLSNVDTDTSSLFGEQLGRTEKHLEKHEVSDPTEEI
jgi:hypothetical protein